MANHPDWKRDAPDEYDNYVQHAATLFENGASIVDVATYLAHIEAEYMSLGVKGTTADRARRTATAIKQYLETATD
ncbi:hypothetical protein BN1012_Phect216 [Candidatus Phaeomarinobacter ectocarpi]|uniref:Uncharacterized protein n=1 Tax=Candidatus Phaeomarinibacter ectocarpi TaxID=1458461 RepID=X5MKB8_9HYPH|nr:hypothetical protein BN1012_Phect216 [Candidatus Phaeomarinobacter ectocarpi]